MSATIHVIRSRRSGKRAVANLRPADLTPAQEAAFAAVVAALAPRSAPISTSSSVGTAGESCPTLPVPPTGKE